MEVLLWTLGGLAVIVLLVALFRPRARREESNAAVYTRTPVAPPIADPVADIVVTAAAVDLLQDLALSVADDDGPAASIDAFDVPDDGFGGDVDDF